jgi:hypothetical protein
MSQISDDPNQAIKKEIAKMKRDLEEKQGLPEDYVELLKIIKAMSAKITNEKT